MLSVKSPYEISNFDRVELWVALHMSIYYHQNPHSFTVQNLVVGGGGDPVSHIMRLMLISSEQRMNPSV